MKNINWKTVIITFVITGFLTTIFVGPIIGFLTWSITKRAVEKDSEQTISSLERQLEEAEQELLRIKSDSSLSKNQSRLKLDNNDNNMKLGNNSSQNKTGWKEYKNARYSFQVEYPSNYSLDEFANGDGASFASWESLVSVYGVSDTSTSLSTYIETDFPDATSIANFLSGSRARGVKFWETRQKKYGLFPSSTIKTKYVVFKGKASCFIIIKSENPDDYTANLVEDIASTFILN